MEFMDGVLFMQSLKERQGGGARAGSTAPRRKIIRITRANITRANYVKKN
jgi:hypothetical protein